MLYKFSREIIDKSTNSCYTFSNITERSFDMAKKKSNSNFITALMYIIIGIICCIFGGGMINWMLTIAGILFIVFGILEIVKKNLIAGIISIVIGIVILLGGWLFVEIIMLIFGILIAIKGVLALIDAIKRKAVIDIVFAVLTIAAGLVFVFAFGEAADIVIRIAGVLLAINGIIELVGKGVSKK